MIIAYFVMALIWFVLICIPGRRNMSAVNFITAFFLCLVWPLIFIAGDLGYGTKH